MPTLSRVNRTSDQICADVVQIFGFLSPFFEPARSTPLVLESLWQMTLLADIDCVLPVPFQQRLNTSLARFCDVPYYMICHASTLRPLALTGGEVLALLKAPSPPDSEVEEQLRLLRASPIILSAFPLPNTPQELALLTCAAVLFLRGPQETACRECLEDVLGPELFKSLSLYLSYIQTCHTWLELHPDISYRPDQRVQDCLGLLLADEPALGSLFQTYRDEVERQRFSRIERKVAVEARQASGRSHAILESIADAFYALDTQWRFTYINAAAERIVQRTREELLGKVVWEEFPEAVTSVVYTQYQSAAAEKVPVSFEFYYGPLTAWLAVRVYPSAEGISVFFQDVTERKAGDEMRWLQAAQREGEERNRLMVDALPHIAWTNGPNGARDYYNQRWYEYSGLTVEETQAGGWEDIMHPEDIPQAAAIWDTAIEAGEAWGAEYRLRRSDGTFRLHLGRSEPIRAAGKIIRWVGTATDIEDRRVAEEALKTSYLRTARILESISDAFYAIDTQWNFTYVNSQAAELLHRSREELMDKNIWAEFPEAVGTKPYLLFHCALETGQAQSFEEYYAPLSTWFEVRAYPSPEGLSVFFRDISERRAQATA